MLDALLVLKGLWVCSLALQAILVYRIFESNLVFRLLWFTTYLSAEVATGLILAWTPLTSPIYIEVWGVARPVICLLQLGVGWEAARRLLAVSPRRVTARSYAVLGATFAALIITAAFALHFEREYALAQPWQYAIMGMGCVTWAIIAISVGIIQAVGSSLASDRNTALHAWLLFALAVTEVLRYGLVVWFGGALVSYVNLASVIAECVLFLLWIVLLKEDAEATALGQPVRA